MFLNLAKQIYDKISIPSDNFITYQNGTTTDSKLAEDWLGIKNDGSCEVSFEIVVSGTSCKVEFQIQKSNEVGIDVKVNTGEVKNFNYPVFSEEAIKTTDFTDIVDFISESLWRKFNKAKELYSW